MVTELQFVAITAFLMWCLVSSLCGLLIRPAEAPARLVWREHGPAGWGAWHEVHFGLTAADRFVLTQPDQILDRAARAAVLDTVLLQTRQPDSDAVQFAIVCKSAEHDQTTAVFVSDHIDVASASLSIEPSLDAQVT
jgi:hypothetical protein